MKKMQKRLSTSLVVAGLLLSAAAQAEGVVFLPVMKEGYKPEAVASVMMGMMEANHNGAESDMIMGAELSFRCIFLQVGDNQLRQQLSFTNWKKDGLTLRNLELNAHYQGHVVDPNFKVGVGPGVGIILTDAKGTDNPTFFGAQVGGSVQYTGFAPLFLGAEVRYQVTNQDKFSAGGSENDMNNWRAAAKVGYIF